MLSSLSQLVGVSWLICLVTDAWLGRSKRIRDFQRYASWIGTAIGQFFCGLLCVSGTLQPQIALYRRVGLDERRPAAVIVWAVMLLAGRKASWPGFVRARRRPR